MLCLSHDSRCSLPGTFSERHLQSEKTMTRTLRTSAPCRNDRPGCLATTVRRTRFAEYNVDLHQVRQEFLHTKKVKQNKKQSLQLKRKPCNQQISAIRNFPVLSSKPFPLNYFLLIVPVRAPPFSSDLSKLQLRLMPSTAHPSPVHLSLRHTRVTPLSFDETQVA